MNVDPIDSVQLTAARLSCRALEVADDLEVGPPTPERVLEAVRMLNRLAAALEVLSLGLRPGVSREDQFGRIATLDALDRVSGGNKRP
jgi:hypothetical protein